MIIRTIDLCDPVGLGKRDCQRLDAAIGRLFPLESEMGIIPSHFAIIEYWRWLRHRAECEAQLIALAESQTETEYYANADDEPLGVTLRAGGFRVVYMVGDQRVVSLVGAMDEADQAFADALHEAGLWESSEAFGIEGDDAGDDEPETVITMPRDLADQLRKAASWAQDECDRLAEEACNRPEDARAFESHASAFDRLVTLLCNAR
jgi:hypothetical protein